MRHPFDLQRCMNRLCVMAPSSQLLLVNGSASASLATWPAAPICCLTRASWSLWQGLICCPMPLQFAVGQETSM